MIDLAIIGSGPAALTAAIYASRAGLTVQIYEKNRLGGALPDISHIANFPGYDGDGETLAKTLVSQVQNLGVYVDFGTCTSLKPLIIDDEEQFVKSVLIATGSEPVHLDLPTTKPVSYCALCDAPLYISKNVLVIGGGNSAVGEALYLAKNIAKTVTVVTHSLLKAEKKIADELRACKNVTIMENTEPTIDLLEQFDGIFVLIGKKPATQFLPQEMLDEDGFIITDVNYMTKVPGVFAAGDVRSGSLKQAITAASDGAMAAINISDFLSLGKHF